MKWSPDFKRILDGKLDMLENIHSSVKNKYFKINPQTRALYVEQLARYQDNEFLWQAIDESAARGDFPTVGDICDKVNELAKRNRPVTRGQLEPSKTEQAAGLFNASMALMWLHYERNWDVMGPTLVELFKRCFPGEKFDMSKLKKEFTEERVRAWARKLKEPLPLKETLQEETPCYDQEY